MDAPEHVEADSDVPMTFVELAAALQRISKPAAVESVELGFDQDDYPLF